MNELLSALSFRDGSLILTSPWGGEAAATILVNGESIQSDWSLDQQGHPSCLHGQWRLTVVAGAAGALSLKIANACQDALPLGTVHFGQFSPAAFSAALQTWRFKELIHGGSFESLATGVKGVGRKAFGLDFVVPSGLLTVYQQEEGEALLLGVLPPVGSAFSEFTTLHSDPHLEGSFGFEIRHRFDCLVPAGEAVLTSPIIAIAGADGTELMQRYGEAWAELLARTSPRPPCVGWNSWDYYSGAITRQAMDENLAAATDLFGDALQVFCIDEGWEQQWGSWGPNAKFPEGLADFCRHVKARGRVPGIWTAPLLVNTYNPLFLAKPQWFAARADGQLRTDSYSYGPMAYLDPTQPEVLDHLRAVFGRLREAGFDYFKVDFTQCILKAEAFADPRVGRADLVRRAFSAIRDAIGSDAYLLACGAPFESVTGLVDGVRTTGDIHIYWGHVLRNAQSLAGRWWMTGNLWNGDPDFLVVRGPDTARPPYGKRQVVTPLGPDGGWLSGRELNEMEARTYALLVHLSGGDVILGDALRQLHLAAVSMIQRVLQPRRPAIPVDLFTSDQDLPRIWISRGETDTLVGLFNWSEYGARLEFDPKAHGLSGTPRDFWTDAPVAALPARMARRSSLALRFATADGTPVFINSS
ncbi:MAG: glycoside hydrolase family 36 protein [Armatimonadota bacterium]